MPQDASRTLLGVDLGGSGFRVRRLARGPRGLETDDEGSRTEWRWPEGVQRGERVGAARVELLADGIAAVLRASAAGSALVALAAPGPKSADGRGLSGARNFPDVPDLVGRLAAGLRERGREAVELALPIHGDGVAAARGEQAEPRGALRGVERGYYLGAGTGLSEALVIAGRVRALDELAPRAFELGLPGGAGSYETRLCAEGIARDPDCAGALSSLVEDRVGRLHTLERVVLGQAFAYLFEDRAASELLAELGPSYRISPLRAAPAIGAVAFALEHEEQHGRDAWVRS